MDLYGQEPEVALLVAFVSHLETKVVIDVGAERGAFAEAMLAAGSNAVHVLEPEPENVALLRERFRDDPRVKVHSCAVGDSDGELRLHRSVDPDGAAVSFGHTVLDRPDTDEITWNETITVQARSLGSLVETGEVPARVGVLKIDTEGHDLAVVSGLGGLECDVVMVEHWSDLPNSLGPCPWSLDEMASSLEPRGFRQFAFIEHRGEFVVPKWNDGSVARGHMGNLVFLHDDVIERLLPDVVACASILAQRAVAVGEMYATAANERLAAIAELEGDRDIQATAASERLTVIEELTREPGDAGELADPKAP